MSFVLIEGRIINMMAVALIDFDHEDKQVEISMIGNPEPEIFGGFDSEGQDIGTPLWLKLKKMATPVCKL